MRYTTLFIDADGTIFDYERAERNALISSVPDASKADADELVDRYRKINRSYWIEFEKGIITTEVLRRERFKKLVEELNIDIDPDDLGQRYLEALGRSGDMIDGAIDVLESLHSRFTLLLLTNGFSATQRGRIDASGIERYFDHIVISEEVGFQKPEPGIFDHALGLCSEPSREEILMIGDSLSSDIKGGNDSGIATCWFNPAGNKPDPVIVPTYEISRLEEIEPIVESG